MLIIIKISQFNFLIEDMIYIVYSFKGKKNVIIKWLVVIIPIFFKIVFLYTYIYIGMKIQVAWSIDHESTHVNTFYNIKVAYKVLMKCFKGLSWKDWNWKVYFITVKSDELKNWDSGACWIRKGSSLNH